MCPFGASLCGWSVPSRTHSLSLLVCALVVVAVVEAPASAARGEYKLERHTMWSTSLGEEVRYRVALPPGYGAPENRGRRYPVIYLLHGLKGSSWDWFYIGRLHQVLAKRLRAGEMSEVIAVSMNGGASYWTRELDRVGRPGRDYARFLAVDFLAEIDRRFRTLRRRQHRSLVGLSMGGFGALSLGLLYPDRFGSAVSLSGALFRAVPSSKKAYRAVWGDPPQSAHFERYSPFSLASRVEVNQEPPRIYIGCGRSDHSTYRERAAAMHERLESREIPHLYQEGEGGHSWSYWVGDSASWLNFVQAGFSGA